jgi:hypothetical protein
MKKLEEDKQKKFSFATCVAPSERCDDVEELCNGPQASIVWIEKKDLRVVGGEVSSNGISNGWTVVCGVCTDGD